MSQRRSASGRAKKPKREGWLVQLPRRVQRALRLRSIVSGIAMGFSRFAFALGLLLFVGWSYSLWGSPSTPLKALLDPALILIAAALVVRIVTGGWLRWTRRAHRVHHERAKVQEWVRSTRAVRKLDNHDRQDPPS